MNAPLLLFDREHSSKIIIESSGIAPAKQKLFFELSKYSEES